MCYGDFDGDELKGQYLNLCLNAKVFYLLVLCLEGGVAQWVNASDSVVSLSPMKGSRCFLEQENLLSLLSTGWFQEQIRVRFTFISIN